MCLDIEEPTSEPFISKSIMSDLKGLYKYDKEFIDGTADDSGWEYTYHQLYSKYYNQLIDELKRNLHTRRACIALGQDDINFTSDPPCLQLMMFNYVNGKLEMTVVFRSNDGVKAFPMNIHAIEMLHQKVANDIGAPVGALHYIANNFHCYSRDFEMLYSYCNTFRTATEKRRFFSKKDYKRVVKSEDFMSIGSIIDSMIIAEEGK
ncbi:MAG: hypothetical protein KBS82_05175 [Oscillospiraceae bacterium]|nr:hypothetical protein [Candidatus Limimonas egerieequi]